jgi:hypothetical protein
LAVSMAACLIATATWYGFGSSSNQHVAFFHPIVVVDHNTGYLAADPRRDERHIPFT